MGTRLGCVFVIISLFGPAHVVQAQDSADKFASKPLITTGVTGSINASGLDDPQYVLSFVPIQRLMLDAAQRPLTKEEIQKAVQGTPVTLDHLLRLELLRQDQDTCRLNYLLLTVQDQETVYRVSARYGQGLADAFCAQKAKFDAIFNRYPNAALRPQLMFGLIAGAALNWGGLDLRPNSVTESNRRAMQMGAYTWSTPRRSVRS